MKLWPKATNKKKKQKPALERGMDLLTRRPYSTVEFCRKLAGEEYPQEEIEAASKRLTELKLLNDVSYASALARYHKTKGNRWLTAKLKQQGVDSEICEQAIETLESEEERLAAALEKKALHLRTDDPKKRYEKLFRFLASRGFSPSLIIKALNTPKSN